MIAPLRKKREDGSTYFRPPAIQSMLEELDQIPIEEVAIRAKISDPKDADYVPSECLVHFVRQSKACGDTKPYCDLFVILRERIARAVPAIPQKVSGRGGAGLRADELEIQDAVVQRFHELLCIDREEYDERLEYFEIRFNSAVKAMRITAIRKVEKYESRRESLDGDNDTVANTAIVERGLARIRDLVIDKKSNDFYRSQVFAAINTLRPKERRVIELLLQGFPIDSKKPEVLTIAKILNCGEQTVRNRRNRAVLAIQQALKMEEVA